jgi:uncharacterized protein YutE (UPF0331/DUF86 family)
MDKERMISKIAEIKKYLAELSEVIPDNLEDYSNSVKDKRATERILQIAIECVLDVCAILVKEFALGLPANEDNLLEILEGKISMIDAVKAMKRFRNVLVYKYGDIKDELVFEFATEKTEDFEQFIAEIKQIMKRG